jgi:hypothetical protein
MREFRTSGSVGASGEQSPEATRPEVPVYGRQEHSAYNGHFESTCYHPLLLYEAVGRPFDSTDRTACLITTGLPCISVLSPLLTAKSGSRLVAANETS